MSTDRLCPMITLICSADLIIANLLLFFLGSFCLMVMHLNFYEIPIETKLNDGQKVRLKQLLKT